MKHSILPLAAAAVLVVSGLAWLLLGTGNSGVDPASVAARSGDASESPTIDRAETLRDVEEREGTQRQAVATAPAAGALRPAAPAASTRQVPDGPYRGRILDALGRPVADVAVELESWADAANFDANAFAVGMRQRREPERTDEKGLFQIKRSTSLGRSIGVTATARGFSTEPMKVVLDDEAGLDLGDIFLEPAVIVEGWVRDTDDRPVAGARVRRIERQGDAMVDVMDRLGLAGVLGLATTDDDGRFELLHEAPGPIVLMIEGDDILPERYAGPSREGGEVLQDLVIRVKRAGKIEGTVLGYPMGRQYGLVAAAPLEYHDEEEGPSGMSALLAAQLSPAGDHTAEVSADGSFVISGLVPGASYRVRAISKKMFVQVDSLSDSADAVANGEPIALSFDAGATVTFQAIDRATREPIEDLVVSGQWSQGPAFLQLSPTAERAPGRYPGGKVTLYELRPSSGTRTLTLTVDAAGYFRRAGVEIEVPESGFADAGKVEFDAAPRLTFHVFDAATRKPIRRARVSLTPASVALDPGTTEDGVEVLDDEQREQREAARAMMSGQFPERARGKTGRDGRVTLTALSGEAMVLDIQARHFADYLDAAFVAPTGGGVIEIALAGGGALEVQVRDTDGVPAQDVRVECRLERGGQTTRTGETTEEDGLARFEHLAAGTHQVRAYRVDRAQLVVLREIEAEWVDVEILRGVTQEVELEVPAVGDLRGVVTLGSEPAVDARVSVVEIERADEAERSIRFQDELAGFGPQGNKSDLTDVEGRFELAGIEPGTYAVLVRHPDVAMVTRKDIEIDDGVTNVEVEILMTVIEGRVVDAEGQPVAGARVSARRHNPNQGTARADIARTLIGASMAKETTGADGRFRLIGVRAGAPLDVIIQAQGYTDQISGPVTVEERETRALAAVELQRGGVIEVTFPGEDLATRPRLVTAKPVGGLALESGAPDKVALMRAGRARLEGLVAGQWQVQSTTRGRRRGQGGGQGETDEPDPEPQTVEVKPGETSRVDF